MSCGRQTAYLHSYIIFRHQCRAAVWWDLCVVKFNECREDAGSARSRHQLLVKGINEAPPAQRRLPCGQASILYSSSIAKSLCPFVDNLAAADGLRNTLHANPPRASLDSGRSCSPLTPSISLWLGALRLGFVQHGQPIGLLACTPEHTEPNA